jgi:hypothetical protein
MRQEIVKIGVGFAAAAAVGLIGVIWLGSHEAGKSSRAAESFAQSDAGVSQKQHDQLVLAALRGSPKAAGELIDLYDKCSAHEHDEAKSAACLKESERWLAIGLQNGSPVAAHIQVISLLQSNDCYDIYRAEYWYKLYRASGFGDRTKWLSDASEIAEKKRICSWKGTPVPRTK